MDDRTLKSLRTALDSTPENSELRFVLIDAYLERQDHREASNLMDGVAWEQLSKDQIQLGAKAYLAADRPDDALKLLESTSELHDEPQDSNLLLLQARSFLALERHSEGLEQYQRAVALNPALEDTKLKDRLSINVRTFPSPIDNPDGRPQLKVYSNDDTDGSELRRLLIPETEKVDFSDVGGLEAVKKQVRKKIILPFQKPSLFQRFKKRIGGGILLYGPPGCGKTLLARATAGECDATFYNVAISDVLDMYIGESEAKLHAIFENAREQAPSVIFFDEIEALGGKRQYTRESTSSKLVSQFLAEMDGFSQNNSGVLILGATNVPWAVDPAFRRPGRFDRLMFVPPPDREARRAILEILVRDCPVDSDLGLDFIAKHTSGFSGADLQNLVETATDEAIEASIEASAELPLVAGHLRSALKEVRATTLEWLTTARNYARYANEGGQYDDVLAFLKKHGK